MDKSRLIELTNLYPDEKRHRYVVANPAWEDIISPAFVEFGNLVVRKGFVSIESMFDVLRFFIEVIFVIGYEQGKNHKDINWTVKES